MRRKFWLFTIFALAIVSLTAFTVNFVPGVRETIRMVGGFCPAVNVDKTKWKQMEAHNVKFWLPKSYKAAGDIYDGGGFHGPAYSFISGNDEFVLYAGTWQYAHSSCEVTSSGNAPSSTEYSWECAATNHKLQISVTSSLKKGNVLYHVHAEAHRKPSPADTHNFSSDDSAHFYTIANRLNRRAKDDLLKTIYSIQSATA